MFFVVLLSNGTVVEPRVEKQLPQWSRAGQELNLRPLMAFAQRANRCSTSARLTPPVRGAIPFAIPLSGG